MSNRKFLFGTNASKTPIFTALLMLLAIVSIGGGIYALAYKKKHDRENMDEVDGLIVSIDGKTPNTCAKNDDDDEFECVLDLTYTYNGTVYQAQHKYKGNDDQYKSGDTIKLYINHKNPGHPKLVNKKEKQDLVSGTGLIALGVVIFLLAFLLRM